jgi:tetratricopeptide (TPR) repeat protein
LARDPGNVDALVGTAFVDFVRGNSYSADHPPTLFAAAESNLTKALLLAPEHAVAHLCLGRVQIHTNRAAQGIAECEQALVLDRNLASAHAVIGVAKYLLGRGEETENHINEALRLSPRDTNAYLWLMIAGIAKALIGSHEKAIALLRRSIEENRSFSLVHFWLAATLAYLGRHNEARAATQAGLALNPTFTVARARAYVASDNPIYKMLCSAETP